MFLISLILLFSKKPARDTISNCFRMCVFEIKGCLNDERRPKTNLVIVVVQRAITMVAAIVACLHFAATLYRHNNEWVTGRRPRMFQQDNSFKGYFKEIYSIANQIEYKSAVIYSQNSFRA